MINLKFGISIPNIAANFTDIFKVIDCKSFSGVELRGNIFENKELPDLLKLYHIEVLNLFNLVEPSILNNIIEQPNNLKQELIKFLYNSIKNHKKFNIQNFSLDFGFSDLSYKDKSASNKNNFLQQLYYPIYKSKKNICVPLTIPNNNLEENINSLSNIIKELMLDNFRIYINIFPHDLKQKISPYTLFKDFIFDIQLFRIIYDPSTGNHLTESLLKFWLDPLSRLNFSGSIIICPNVNSIESLEKEIEKILIIIKKFKM